MEIMEDTIAAIATAVSEAGISIVRISGKQAIETAARIFRSGKKDFVLEEQPSHTIHYGFIYDGEERVDEVLLLLMKGPHSYTGEDTVEIDWGIHEAGISEWKDGSDPGGGGGRDHFFPECLCAAHVSGTVKRFGKRGHRQFSKGNPLSSGVHRIGAG